MAAKLLDLPTKIRSRAVSVILAAHWDKISVEKLIAAQDQFRRLGILLNQSLRASGGRDVDQDALKEAVQIVKGLTG